MSRWRRIRVPGGLEPNKNEAVSQYFSLNEYHRQLIEEGIRDDDVGDLIDHEAVQVMAAGWMRNRSAR